MFFNLLTWTLQLTWAIWHMNYFRLTSVNIDFITFSVLSEIGKLERVKLDTSARRQIPENWSWFVEKLIRKISEVFAEKLGLQGLGAAFYPGRTKMGPMVKRKICVKENFEAIKLIMDWLEILLSTCMTRIDFLIHKY